MLYVSCKVDNGFKVYDTDDNSCNIYTSNELQDLYDGNVKVKGCDYVGGIFTVTPVPPCYGRGRNGLAKSKMTTGYLSGIKGMILDVDGEDVVLKELTRDFYNYICSNAMGNRAVITIPDTVTRIGYNAFDYPYLGDIKNVDFILKFDMPESVKIIDSSAGLMINGAKPIDDHCFYIDDVVFNGVIDRVRGRDIDSITGSLSSGSEEFTLRVKHLESESLVLSDVKRLYLPDIKTLDFNAVTSDRGRLSDIQVFLGKNLKVMRNFLNNRGFSGFMTNATPVYFSDNCDIDYIDFRSEGTFDQSYFFIMSENESKRFWHRLNNGNIYLFFDPEPKVVVGLLTYKDETELNQIKDNILEYRKYYNAHFNTYLKREDLGSIVPLKLI